MPVPTTLLSDIHNYFAAQQAEHDEVIATYIFDPDITDDEDESYYSNTNTIIIEHNNTTLLRERK